MLSACQSRALVSSRVLLRACTSTTLLRRAQPAFCANSASSGVKISHPARALPAARLQCSAATMSEAPVSKDELKDNPLLTVSEER